MVISEETLQQEAVSAVNAMFEGVIADQDAGRQARQFVAASKIVSSIQTLRYAVGLEETARILEELAKKNNQPKAFIRALSGKSNEVKA